MNEVDKASASEAEAREHMELSCALFIQEMQDAQWDLRDVAEYLADMRIRTRFPSEGKGLELPGHVAELRAKMLRVQRAEAFLAHLEQVYTKEVTLW